MTCRVPLLHVRHVWQRTESLLYCSNPERFPCPCTSSHHQQLVCCCQLPKGKQRSWQTQARNIPRIFEQQTASNGGHCPCLYPATTTRYWLDSTTAGKLSRLEFAKSLWHKNCKNKRYKSQNCPVNLDATSGHEIACTRQNRIAYTPHRSQIACDRGFGQLQPRTTNPSPTPKAPSPQPHP